MSINRNLSFLAEGASSSGVLSVTKGGTGLTTLTAGYIPYGNGTSALSSSSSLYFDGTNLGVGTSSPSTKLTVSSTYTSSRGQLSVVSTDTDVGQTFYVGSTFHGVLSFSSSYGYIGTASNTPLVFGANNAGRMWIDTSGNVGIGTASPSANLDVSATSPVIKTTGTTGNSYYRANNTGGNFYFGIDTSTGSTFGVGNYSRAIYSSGAYPVVFFTNDVERARISSAGGFSVGTTADPGAGLISDQYGNLRSLPLNSQTSAYVVAASDNGKVISITTGGVTINNSIMSAGMVVTIYNNSGSSQTITQGTGVTLQWAGQSSSTTGNRTLGLYGMATVYFLSASSAVITGSGLT